MLQSNSTILFHLSHTCIKIILSTFLHRVQLILYLIHVVQKYMFLYEKYMFCNWITQKMFNSLKYLIQVVQMSWGVYVIIKPTLLLCSRLFSSWLAAMAWARRRSSCSCCVRLKEKMFHSFKPIKGGIYYRVFSFYIHVTVHTADYLCQFVV